MLIGIKSWWAFVLLFLATALCVVTGNELARTIGQGAAAGWYAVLAANFGFTLLAIFLCDWLVRTWALREDDFNRPLETLTLAVSVLGPLGVQGFSFALSPSQSDNVSIVSAYLIRKFPENGHDYYLQVVVATLLLTLSIAVVAIQISNDLDKTVGRWLAIALEFLALLSLLASSLLLLPWITVEPSSLQSVSVFGGFIVGQIVIIVFIAVCVTLTIATVRTLPVAIKAARAAAVSTLHILGQIVAAAVVAFLCLIFLSKLLALVASTAPPSGRIFSAVANASEAAESATWEIVSIGLIIGGWIIAALTAGAVLLSLFKKLPKLKLPPRPSAKQMTFVLGGLVIAFGLFQAILFSRASNESEVSAVGSIVFSRTDVACTNATWMIGQANRITAPVERCFPLDDADFVVAIGDATPLGRPRDEEDRGRRRAESLAMAISSRYPELEGRIYALNIGVTTSENSGDFEAKYPSAESRLVSNGVILPMCG